MVSKCANPSCSATFHHRHGKLFRFPKRPVEEGRPANTHAVQHFWLCEICCATYSLEYHEAKGVALRCRFEPTPGPDKGSFIAAA
jgi:hypothetical protein